MENKIATDLEQSKKLLELGIDADTADMHWESISDDDHRLGLFTVKETKESLERMQYSLKTTFNVKLSPAWSLSALMNFLPKGGFVLVKDSVNEKYHLYTKEYIPTGNCISSEKLVDAVFEMIVYLKEIKFI